MKKVLIITGHFPPSNLAAVHRSRLFAHHLSKFDWCPLILTVDEKYYEESLDTDLEKLLPINLRVEKVKAFGISKPRIIGDIGLRSFFQLYKKAKQIIIKEKIEFLLIHIPSFYTALLGRWLQKSTKIKYGIDYIDPWVQIFSGSDKLFSRHWLSSKLSRFLERIAVKKASLITGVAEGYYQGVIDRNSELLNNCIFGAMPYGGEKADHENLHLINKKPFLFKKNAGKIHLIYAGAMLPTAYSILNSIFKVIKSYSEQFKLIEFHFIGTGKASDDPLAYNIKPLAEKHGLWNSIIFEYPRRIPYLDVLRHLNYCDGIFILGGIEPHYTPSKVYQAVLSNKPIYAVLNKESSAVQVLRKSGAGIVLDFNGEKDIKVIEMNFLQSFMDFIKWLSTFNPDLISLNIFQEYSAENVTKKLAELLNKAIALK